MAPEPTGICPNCETRTGPVGERCPGDVCARRGYAFIPRPWYDAAREFAVRKQRPLDPLLGRSIDRYLLSGYVGEGGMGTVYLAVQRPLNREVALKVISGLEMTQTTIARFEREARAISVLDHPNIVKIHDYGIGELEFRVPYMALEYVRHGRTLRRALAQMRQEGGGAPIPGEVVRAIFAQVLHALQTAHAVGIVHRDMKPDNVMLAPVAGNPYFVKVLDFGLAKAVSEVSGFDGTVSRTGLVLGTPLYMAPEQATGMAQTVVDGRADLYAVAVMLFEVFTGARPFEGESALAVLAKKADPSYDPLDHPEARRLPKPLRAFLSRGMAVKPDSRYGDAQEMLSAFEGALSGRHATAMGMAAGTPGSSDERPATPPSPAEGVSQEPTARIQEREEEPASWIQGPEGAARRSRQLVWWRPLAMAGAVLAVAAVTGGTWLAGGGRPGPGPSQTPAEDVAAARGDASALVSAADLPAVDGIVALAPDMPAFDPSPALASVDAVPAVADPGPLPGEAVQSPVVRVRFVSEPPGAAVLQGGRRLGRTPFDAVLEGEAGSREFTFRLKGYRDEPVKDDIADGVEVRATLRRKVVEKPPPQTYPAP